MKISEYHFLEMSLYLGISFLFELTLILSWGIYPLSFLLRNPIF